MSAVGTVWDSKERLKMIDYRLRSFGLNPAEVARLTVARADVAATMSDEELKDYAALMGGASKEQIEESRRSAEKEMEENRDKPSI